MTITIPTIILSVGGSDLTFAGPEVVSASIIEEVAPLSTELPYNVLEFKIHNTDTSFSMFSGSTYNLLSERLPVLVYENIDGISRFMGKFYLDDWKNPNDYEFDFRAIDAIGTLSKTDFDGGFWSTAITLENILAEILTPLNIPYEIDSTIKSRSVGGWIPPGDYRAALQQICFAASAVASCARSEKIIISPVDLPYQTYDVKIKKSGKLQSQPVELLKLVTSIEVFAHNYTAGTELKVIYDKYMDAGVHKIVFDKPYFGFVIDGPGYVPDYFELEDGTLFELEDGSNLEISGEYVTGSNAVYLNMQEAGQVTISGYEWLDSKKSFIFYETGTTEYSNKNALVISDATMVNNENAADILEQLKNYYRQRYKQTITLLPSTVQTRDVIQSSTLFDKNLLGLVTKMDMNLVGGFLQETVIRGIEPVYVPDSLTPVRRERVGIAICGAGLTENNQWRRYA